MPLKIVSEIFNIFLYLVVYIAPTLQFLYQHTRWFNIVTYQASIKSTKCEEATSFTLAEPLIVG